MSELLINDYTRKGFVDGLCVRLPTICIRPRKPNKAASSFVSSIIREPLHGETSICPVAEKMAFSFIKFLGKKKEEWALAITGYVVSIPIVLPILLIFIKAILDLGNDGSVIDLIFPLGILALIMGYVQVQNKTL